MFKTNSLHSVGAYRSFNIPPPKDETLMRHSILGPNGLHGQWQPPVVHQLVLFVSKCLRSLSFLKFYILA